MRSSEDVQHSAKNKFRVEKTFSISKLIKFSIVQVGNFYFTTLAAKKISLFGELVENVVKTFGYFYPKRIVEISECSPNKNRNDYGRIFSEKNRNDFVTISL